MGPRDLGRSRRRALLAALLGVVWALLAGAEVLVPALALVALVHTGGLLVAAARGEIELVHPDLAIVVATNAAVVLLVQLLLAIAGAA